MDSSDNGRRLAQLEDVREATLSYLKPFQRETVKHIEGLFEAGARRVLVSDEVGLGKTLIAKGVVATTALLREKEQDDFFKVVYVCSNSAIANQNLAKLTIDEGLVDRVDASSARLSMQHFASFRNEQHAKRDNSYVQLIPLTPGTSFNVTNGQGTVQERALIFAVLRRFDAFAGLEGKLEAMFREPAPASWTWWRDFYEKETASEDGYLENMMQSLEPYRESLSETANYLKNRTDRSGDRARIGRIRRDFALLSIERLDPDLVIMDEFQRFRDLLDTSGESDLSLISKRFLFSEARADDPTRVLLLSATPFKPFSTAAEDESFFGDSSAQDFMRIVDFLSDGGDARDGKQFEEVWKRYGVVLSQYVDGIAGLAAVKVAKADAEQGLRALMTRTERDGMREYSDVVQDCSEGEIVQPDRADIAAQLLARRLFDRLGVTQRIPFEYAESCPFLLSYLKGYKLGDKLLRAVESSIEAVPFKREGNQSELLWVRRQKVARLEELKIPNARFKALMADVFETGAPGRQDASSLLWIPPSRPYYTVDRGPFAKVRNYSKTLVFSSWTMVPRMASTLLSYEDERRSVDQAYGKDHGYSYFDKDAERDADEMDAQDSEDDVAQDASRQLPSNRLRAPVAAKRGAALLLYPCRALATAVEWPAFAREASLEQLVESVGRSIASALESIVSSSASALTSERDDLRWYAKAMFLLDREAGVAPTGLFSEALAGDQATPIGKKLIGAWMEIDETPVEEMGRMPSGLARTLAEAAIASPAVCALRTLSLCERGDAPLQPLAYRFASAFVRKMNTPSATLAIDSGMAILKSRQSHWEAVLSYCALGNFQSVLDEYGHQLGFHRRAEAVCADMVGGPVSTFKHPSLYTMQSHYEVDTLQNLKSRAKDKGADNAMRMRTGFAAAFIEDEGGGNNTDRRENLRRAFNSPFRPFVLCSTSVGQEGLDFHGYCRKIVHWNLPSNPIDFEQREGRVNRYESLAIRQNIARRYDDVPYIAGEDIWKSLFDRADQDTAAELGDSLAGLAPHWGLPHYSDEDVRIERHTYLRKFSKAEQRYDRLIDVLVRYRAVLGQPRQEELLAKLGDKLSEKETRDLFMDLAPFNYRNR